MDLRPELEKQHKFVSSFKKDHKYLLENDLGIKFESIINILKMPLNSFNIANLKNLVLVIGLTGEGKSTLVNCLINKKLIKKRYEDIKNVIDIDESENCNHNAKIFHESISGTLLPEIFQYNSFNYCDCPGFDDNRCLEEKLFASFSFNRLLNQCESVKGVIITIDSNSVIDCKAKNFRELIKILSNLFKDEKILNSCIWVFTKPKNHNEDTILKKLRFFLNSEKKYLLKNPQDKERQTLVNFIEFITNNPKKIVIGNVLASETRQKIENLLETFNNSKDYFNLDFNEIYNEIYDALNIFLIKSEEILKYHLKNIEEHFQFEINLQKLLEKYKKNNNKLNEFKLFENKKIIKNEDYLSKYNKKEKKNLEELRHNKEIIESKKKELSKIENDYQILNSDEKINIFSRIFRNEGIFLLKNPNGECRGILSEYSSINCREHKSNKEIVNWKEYLEITQIGNKNKSRIHLIKPTTVSIDIFMLEKNLPGKKLKIENLMKEIERNNEEINDLDFQINKLEEDWNKMKKEHIFECENIVKDTKTIEKSQKKIEDKIKSVINEINDVKLKIKNLIDEIIDFKKKITDCSDWFSLVIKFSENFNINSDFFPSFRETYYKYQNYKDKSSKNKEEKKYYDKNLFLLENSDIKVFKNNIGQFENKDSLKEIEDIIQRA